MNARATPEKHPMETCRILVAGTGNVRAGDDGFGVAVAQALAGRSLPAGVCIGDYGVRRLDLAYALQEDFDAAILLEAAPFGDPPGTLRVFVAHTDEPGPEGEPLQQDPAQVVALARALGHLPAVVLVVNCEPAADAAGQSDPRPHRLLGPAARAAVPAAAALVEALIEDLGALPFERRRSDEPGNSH